MAEPARYVTRDELAEILRIGTHKVDDLRHRGLPALRWGYRTVRFDREVALRWVNEHGYQGGTDEDRKAA